MKFKNLFLIVSKKWYDKIASGRKRVEYREHTEYWINRLIKPNKNPFIEEEFKDFKSVKFQCGYNRKYSRLKFSVGKIEIIRTPQEVRDTVKTEYCFAIHFE